MTAQLKRFAPTLLMFGIILVVYSLFWTLVRGQWELVSWIILGVGLIAIAGYVALEPAQVWSALTGRTARQGANATVVSLAVIGILILLNVLAARHSKRFDLTAERQFSLSKQTLQVLAGLKEPVNVTAFMSSGYYARQTVQDLLEEYTYHSDKLKVEFIDLDQRPALARQYQITRDGTVIFESGGRRQEALGSDEQEFTSALVKLTREQAKAVYFVTGHRERSPQDSGDAGYQQIAEALKRDNYRVETLNLTITSTVPADCAALVLASPMVAPAEKEIEAIKAYIDRGGSLFVLTDPQSDVSLDELLGRWHLSARNDIVLDPAMSFFGDIASPVVDRFPYHTITKDLGGLTTFFPLARSIASPKEPVEGVQVSPLVQTSQSSWGETDRENRQARLDAGKDTPGPLDLAVAATLELPKQGSEDQPKRARLVVFGDADLCSNGVLWSIRGSGNPDLFLNSVNWLAEEEALISIRPNQPTERTIILSGVQQRLVLLTSMLFMPVAVVVAGAWVWWKRR